MAIGDSLTLVKTENGVPWYKAFGVMQHLTPSIARTMINIPWYAWEDAGIETKLKITRIQVQPTPSSVRPIISIGVSNIGGIGATIENGVVTHEGAMSSQCETQCIESSIIGEPYTVYGGYMNGDVVNMSFYTNEHNDVYIGLAYGSAYNRGTAFVFGYKNANNFYATTGSTPNNATYPNNDKSLYCDGVSINNLFACVDLSCLFKACSFDFKVSCPMFTTYDGFIKYRDEGDDSESIEELTKEDVAKDRTTILYLEAQEYKSEFSMRAPSERLGRKKRIEFYVESTDKTGDKIDYINRAVWGFVHNDSVKPVKRELLTSSNIYNGKEAQGDFRRHINLINNVNAGCLWKIPVNSGDVIHITSKNSGLKAWYVLMDSNDNLIDYDPTNKTLPFTMNITQNCFICFNVYTMDNTPFDFSDYEPSVYTLDGGGSLTDYKNITFVKNPSFNVYKILENGVDVTLSYDWSKRFTVWENNVLYNNEYYWSNIDTNMYIFESYQKGIDSITSGIINNLLNKGFGVSDTVETTLTDNIVNYDCGMSETWILDEASARKLATQFNMQLNDNNTNIIGDVIIGLSMYQNPIDVVVDFFDIPIEIDDFYESEYDTFSFGININEILPNNESNNS